MKTAISIPDPIFEAAEELAKSLGMSRSQLYTTAITRLLESLEDQAVMKRLNQVYEEVPASVDPVLFQMQLHTVLKTPRLPEEEW